MKYFLAIFALMMFITSVVYNLWDHGHLHILRGSICACTGWVTWVGYLILDKLDDLQTS